MSSFKQVLEEMKAHGMALPAEKVQINVPDAKTVLWRAVQYFVKMQTNEQAVWLPEYEQVAEWLTNNHGRGLFLFGNCGRGKTILSCYAIKAILLKYSRKIVSCYDVQQLNSNPDEILKKHIVCIDDVGTEDLSISFGQRRLPFAELMDAAEKQGKLVIITTNLTGEEISLKYGARVMDRIKATTERIAFNGESLRK